MLRNRRHTIPALVSMSLGIGAATILFSLVKGVLLVPLPYEDPDRLVLLRARNVHEGATLPFVSVPDFRDWERRARSLEGMALYHWQQLDLPGEGGTERVQGLQVTPEFFRVLRLTATVGRLPDTRPGGDEARSIVLSRGLWRRRFGGDESLIGTTIDVNSWRSLPSIGSVPYRVLAVVDQRSRFLPMASGLDQRPVGVDDTVEFWLPLRLEGEALTHRELRGYFGAVARLASGVTVDRAEAELQAIAAALAARYPDSNRDWSVAVVPLAEAVTGALRPALWLLLAGVGLLLVISCSNVASLQLVRTFERRREFALRSALGATSTRLVRQVLTETATLVLSGGALGVAGSVLGLRLLKTVAPEGLPRLDTVAVDAGVVLFAVLLSAATGLVTGCAPAWQATRAPAAAGLETGGRPAGASPESRHLLPALASLAIAVALVLLIGAGLLRQSVSRLLAVDPGYDRHNVLTLTVSLPEAKYAWRRNTDFLREAIARLSDLPGVEAVGAVRGMPGRETRIEVPVWFPDRPDSPTAPPRTRIRVVTPSYFRAMGIPLLAGRTFEPPDEVGEIGYTRVALVNEAFAERFWPGGGAVGERFGIVNRELPPMEVIGVVGDVRYETLERPPGPEIYYPEALFPQARTDLLIRTRAAPMALASVVQAEIREIEPDVLIMDVRTLDDALHATLADRRFASWLFGAFSAMAFLLALAGVVGVMARYVALQRRELGVRLALGARAQSIMRMVLARSLVLTAAGVAMGVSAALTGSGLLAGFLYATEPTDVTTYVVATMCIVAAATLASYVPARSAARTDPLDVLRAE